MRRSRPVGRALTVLNLDSHETRKAGRDLRRRYRLDSGGAERHRPRDNNHANRAATGGLCVVPCHGPARPRYFVRAPSPAPAADSACGPPRTPWARRVHTCIPEEPA